jgi:hypothetical protein
MAAIPIPARRSKTGKLKPQTQQRKTHISLIKNKQNGMLGALPFIRENAVRWRRMYYYRSVHQIPKEHI